MELLFIRHAQPEWVQDGISRLDPPLTDLGRKQADMLAERARAWEIDEIWCSPTTRTRQTAEPVVEALAKAPIVYDWLEELRMPTQWEGQPAEAMAPAFKAARERPADDWWEGMQPGGETFRDFFARVTGGLDDALGERGAKGSTHVERTRVYDMAHHEKRIVIVGHGGTNSVAVAHLLGLPEVPWSWERFVLSHASVTRLRSKSLIGGRIFGLRELSCCRHLPEPLVTR